MQAFPGDRVFCPLIPKTDSDQFYCFGGQVNKIQWQKIADEYKASDITTNELKGTE